MLPLEDKVELDVGGFRTSFFQTVEMTSDLYDPAGSWRMTLGAEPKAKKGDRIVIHVNGIMELTGIVDRVSHSYSLNEDRFDISGRSLMGLVADTYIVDWAAPPQKITTAAKKYLADIPFVKECPVILEDKSLDSAEQNHAMDVGDSVFSLLSEYAQNRGLIFWMKPDGTVVFGKAVSSGAAAYYLDSTNIERGALTEDISRMHSEIIIVSDDGSHRKITAANSMVPVRKPFVATYNGHSSEIKRQANNYLRQEKMSGFELNYSVAGYSQGGANWRINSMVHVDDARLGISGNYVLKRRTFRYDRQSGRCTDLVLGPVLEDPFRAYLKRGRKAHPRTSRGVSR